MREIRFRAWDKRDKKFIMDYRKVLPCSYEGEKYDVKVGGGRNHLSVYVQNDYGEDCELLLYTNLKDKNGREIYEKDIVKFKLLTRDGEKRGIGIVEWNDIERAWVVKVVKSDSGMPIMKYYLLGFIKDEQLRVIGNIYENPELLEEADEE